MVFKHTSLWWTAVLGGAIALAHPLAALAVAPPRIDQPVLHLSQVPTPFPVLPPPPNPAPRPQAPALSGIIDLAPGPTTEVGIGHLRPRTLEGDRDQTPAQWLQRIRLPIYAEPGGEAWGWLFNGWLVPTGGEALAIGRDAGFLMVRATPNLFSFPVLEKRPDGWFRFQYTPAGSAWAHESHLEQAGEALIIEPWESHLLQVNWVTFRRPGATQSLRAAPDNTGDILALIGPDSYIEPLAIEGSWMRVRITQPTRNCNPLPGARTQEGWLRWQDGDDPLVWHSPTTCPNRRG